MSQAKVYTNAANTARAAKAELSKTLGLDKKEVLKTVHFNIVPVESGYMWVEVKAEPVVEEPIAGNFTYCPRCDIHLSNGVSDYNTQVDVAKSEGSNEPLITHEFVCLGCGEEFGKAVKPVTVKAKPTTSRGLKIQKDREERNGIKRPSEGGKCAEVWAHCDELYNGGKNLIPMPKQLKAWAQDNDHNVNNAVIELYQWRKFMGFTSRK